jgi:hypothetical protein
LRYSGESGLWVWFLKRRLWVWFLRRLWWPWTPAPLIEDRPKTHAVLLFGFGSRGRSGLFDYQNNWGSERSRGVMETKNIISVIAPSVSFESLYGDPEPIRYWHWTRSVLKVCTATRSSDIGEPASSSRWWRVRRREWVYLNAWRSRFRRWFWKMFMLSERWSFCLKLSLCLYGRCM